MASPVIQDSTQSRQVAVLERKLGESESQLREAASRSTELIESCYRVRAALDESNKRVRQVEGVLEGVQLTHEEELADCRSKSWYDLNALLNEAQPRREQSEVKSPRSPVRNFGIQTGTNTQLSGSSFSSPELTVNTTASKAWAVECAQKKFDDLDVARCGYLEGVELLGLVKYLWSEYVPAGIALSPYERQQYNTRWLLDESQCNLGFCFHLPPAT